MSLLISALYAAAALLGAAFAAIELRMLWRFLRHREAILGVDAGSSGKQDRTDDDHPTVTIQIPLYNERTAADRILRSAAAQVYPRGRFDIQVLDDSTDETTAIVDGLAERIREDGVRISVLRRSDRAGYKAGAMAEGLRRSDADFVAVFDADFIPEPGFLQALLVDSPVFDEERVAFAQARWSWGTGEQQGWLARSLALLLDRHFRVQKRVRAYAGHVTTFNGSAGIWRRAAIEDAGGWTSDTLTEDLDLSYRCALAGWRGRYVHDVHVVNELPAHMRAFKLQQRRWAKGNAQCFRKLTAKVLRPGAVRSKWDEAFMLAGYAIHPLLLASLLLWPWAVLYTNRALFWILQGFMSLGIIAAAVSFLVTIRERDHRWRPGALGEVFLSVCVGLGLMVNNTVGQIQGFVAAGGEFVRTPKRPAPQGETSAISGAQRPYESPLHWTFFVELLVIGYCLAGASVLIQRGEGLWALAMIFWAGCLGLMVQQQLVRAPS